MTPRWSFAPTAVPATGLPVCDSLRSCGKVFYRKDLHLAQALSYRRGRGQNTPLDVAPYSLLRDTKLVSRVYDRLVDLPLDCDRHYMCSVGRTVRFERSLRGGQYHG